jgi:hypothetical protein
MRFIFDEKITYVRQNYLFREKVDPQLERIFFIQFYLADIRLTLS